MATTHFDGFLTDGTDDVFFNLRLVDGLVISVQAEPDADSDVHVYLPDTIPTPDGDGWRNEDQWEAKLTAGDNPADGRYFWDVPVADVRALIEEHGGEHAYQGV
ncbi:hypothetical protein ABTX34_17060 [Streptomyces sp. NPDC096538]|uniref:hypothetical protein n=1 Tax=Streptomyces sp. NPDC096538 TaxID=3155427 RepID=UPI0033284BE1